MAGDNPRLAGSGTRRGDIQGLRAVAVLLVVIYHANLGFSGGFVGVDVFFVISGYVITNMLTAELGRTDRIGLGRFYLRRIRRLLPALGLMLTVVMLASSLLAPVGGQQITARTGAAAALFNANTYLIRFGGAGYFDVDSSVNALLHTWSLSVEEQFYFVFPAALFVAWAVGRRIAWIGTRASVASALVLISVLSFLLSWTVTAGRFSFMGIDAVDDFSGQFAFYSSLTRAWEFAAGGLLALASRRLSNLARTSGWVLAILGVALVGYSAIQYDDQTPFPGTAALVPVAGSLCLLAAGEGRSPNFVSRGLAFRPAQYLGDLSYSWYLWHWPFIVFAAAWWPRTEIAAPAAAVISLAPAWLSYRFVEGPIRFARRPAVGRTLILASVCVLLPLGSAVALVGSRQIVRETDAMKSYDYSRSPHADAATGCTNAIPLGERGQSDCTWAVANPIGNAVLVGDSHAGQFSEAFIGAANQGRFDATVATMPGCPFVDLDLADPEGNTAGYESCRRFVVETLDELTRDQPDLVVIASSSEGWIESQRGIADPSTDMFEYTAEAKATLWQEGLSRTISFLTDAGIEVAVMQAIPRIPDFDTRKCAVLRLAFESDVCAPSVERVVADRTRRRAILAEAGAASSAGAATVDVATVLCPDGTCATRRDGNWIWSDTHISVYASTQLIPTLSALF